MLSETVPILVQIETLEQFSDHADTPELLEWLCTFTPKPATTYLAAPASHQLLRRFATR